MFELQVKEAVDFFENYNILYKTYTDPKLCRTVSVIGRPLQERGQFVMEIVFKVVTPMAASERVMSLEEALRTYDSVVAGTFVGRR